MLSLGERAGVRGNESYSNRTGRTIAGTVKLQESSGKAGGLPLGLIGSFADAVLCDFVGLNQVN